MIGCAVGPGGRYSALRALALLNRIRIAGMIERHEWVSQAQANRADAWVRGTGGIWVLLFVATIVLWCMWQHRAHQTARDLVGGTKMSAAWAFGCWFVPIVNYFKPFQAVRELWRASVGSLGLASTGRLARPGLVVGVVARIQRPGALQSTTAGPDLEAIRRSDAIGLALGDARGGRGDAGRPHRARRHVAAGGLGRDLRGAGHPPVLGAGVLPAPPGPPLPPPPGAAPAG